jgi:hypothetical protein
MLPELLPLLLPLLLLLLMAAVPGAKEPGASRWYISCTQANLQNRNTKGS